MFNYICCAVYNICIFQSIDWAKFISLLIIDNVNYDANRLALIFCDWNAVWFNNDTLNISGNSLWYNIMNLFEEPVELELLKPTKGASLIDNKCNNEGFYT